MYEPRPVRKVAALIADIRWRSLSIFRTGRTGIFSNLNSRALSPFADQEKLRGFLSWPGVQCGAPSVSRIHDP